MPTRDVFNERGSRPLCSPRCVFSLYIFVWPVTCRRRSIDGHKRPRLAQEFRDERRKGEAEKKKERKLFPFLFRCDLVAATIIHTRYLLAVLSPCFVRAQSVRRTPLRGSRQRTVVYIIDIQMPPSNTEISVVCSLRSVAILMNGPAFLSLTTMNSHIYERPAFPRPSA